MNPYEKPKSQYDLVEETRYLAGQINHRLANLQHRNRDKVEGREDRVWLRCRRSQEEIERVRFDYHILGALERDEPVWASDESCTCWGSRFERPHVKLHIGGIKEVLCPVVICLKIQKSCLRHGMNMDVNIYNKLLSLARPTTLATSAPASTSYERGWLRTMSTAGGAGSPS